jgi:hypothetical protein
LLLLSYLPITASTLTHEIKDVMVMTKIKEEEKCTKEEEEEEEEESKSNLLKHIFSKP